MMSRTSKEEASIEDDEETEIDNDHPDNDHPNAVARQQPSRSESPPETTTPKKPQ
jgi:hypothetical protein